MSYLLLESGSRTLLESGAGGGAILLEGFAGADVIAAIQAWWDGTPTVQALVADGRLWHAVAAEPVPPSYATIFLVSETTEVQTTGYREIRSTVQINLHADTDTAARTAAATVRSALLGAPLVIAGQDVMHCLPDFSGIAIGEDLGAGGRDCWVATETFDVLWTD